MVTRSNHDCQFLLSKHHVLASIHYVIKYISKPEASLHSRLTIAAAIRRALQSSSTSDIAKTMLLKTYNKLDSHREVGIPEAISHLLQFPDHFTDAVFQNLHTTRLLEHLRPSRRTVTTQPDDRLLSPEDRQGDDNPFDAQVVVDKRYRMLSAFEDYACRGDALDGYCLYDYHSLVYKKAGRTGGLIFASRHPQHTTYRQFLRAGRPAIPTLLGKLLFLTPHAIEPQKREDYFCILAGLFFPWSCDSPLKATSEQDESWEHFFHDKQSSFLSPRLCRYIENLDLLRKSKEEARIDRLQRRARISTDLHRDGIDDDNNDDDVDGDETTTFVPLSEPIRAAIANLLLDDSDCYVREALDASFDNG